MNMDLEKFFDQVNHDLLLALVYQRIEDKTLLCLIRRILRAPVMVKGKMETVTAGTPQGGPLSPLLSNRLLTDLDRELERHGHKFVRYADDCAPRKFTYMVNDEEFESLAMTVTGAEVRKAASIDESFNLYLEDRPLDLLVTDATTVFVTGEKQRFYTTPKNINGG